MTWFSQRASLQTRLLALLLGLVTLTWAGAAALTWRYASDEMNELLDGHLAQSAALLVVQQFGHVHDDSNTLDDVQQPPVEAPALHKYAPKVAFQVFHEGRLTLRSPNAGVAPMSDKLRGFRTVTLADGERWRVFGARGNENDVQVFVGERIASRQEILWASLVGLMAPLGWALPALGVLGWLAVRQGLLPLRALSQVLEQRRAQDLAPLEMPTMPSEIAPVVQSINTLLARIDKLLQSERRFTADAAHELRTPIAAIRTQAQVALAAQDDQATRARALQQTLAGCDRATHLVTQLLTLARLEASVTGAGLPVLDLSALSQQVAAEVALTALDQEQDLMLEAPQPCWIQADATLAGVLVRNLLDNALRYSPTGAQVLLRVYAEDERTVLTVDDSGPGLTPEQMARLGERFYRVPGSEKSGSGLGWSIVRRIAAVFDAEIEVRRSNLGGLGVQVRWPAATHAAPPT
ncbi:MAG: quorum sensing histidine kinase QseC [Rhodoferax sp.]